MGGINRLKTIIMADAQRRKRNTKLNRKLLKFSIETNDGIIAKVARELNLSRQYIYRMVKKWKLEPIIEECRTRQVDIALSTIGDHMDDVDVALKYLAIQARKEAAIEKRKITVEDQNGIKITVEDSSKASELQEFMEDD